MKLTEILYQLGIRSRDLETTNKLNETHNRFQAALQFLKKTTTSRDGDIPLNELPRFLLLGPANGGKTTLLANSNVHFILQRQFKNEGTHNLSSSDNCDWWVTRDISIVDVPGKYICARGFTKNFKIYPEMWRLFLQFLKKNTGKNSIAGIVIALPLPEIMKQKSTRNYELFVSELILRLQELQKTFGRKLNYQIVITKCDLLPGFTEFFAESTTEEVNQAWGFSLKDMKSDIKLYDFYSQRFDALTKKINQQLIWRLHQERNPLARPYIKDFPLQVERLKERLGEFLKQIHEALPKLHCQGIYLTSALQSKPEPETKIIDAGPINAAEKQLQLFKPPLPLSRPYFIKQFITMGLQTTQAATVIIQNKWKKRAAIAAAIGVVGLSSYAFFNDFQVSIQQAYALQHKISDYKVTLLQTPDFNEQLIKTIELLNSLQQIVQSYEFKLDLKHIMKFYSYKAHEKANGIYQQSLQKVLLPEIKNYITDYLKHPVNKSSDKIYAALKTYLMLGDPSRLDASYVLNTVRNIVPASIPDPIVVSLNDHLNIALQGELSGQYLDKNTIEDARRYLVTMPTFDLSYIILKSYNDNSIASSINLPQNNGVFYIEREAILPTMFTYNNFALVYNQQAVMAATDATRGNWVIGDNLGLNIKPESALNIVEQLRNAYVNNYVENWEDWIAGVRLVKPANLKETDALIVTLISDDSPLLKLLQTVHDNTYFDPVTSASAKLQQLGALAEKNAKSQQELNQMFTMLRNVHNYIQAIQTAENEPKAAFEVISARMKNPSDPDMLTTLRAYASTQPEPIKGWLQALSDHTLRYLMQDASHYINTAWEEKVIAPYQTDISDRYPFSKTMEKEVELKKFIEFFGNPGVIMSFYNDYLSPFIETGKEWHWKKLQGEGLDFTNESLRQLQQAIQIHHTFFPNSDNKLYLQFSLQPYRIANMIKSVKLNINDAHFIDSNSTEGYSHEITWPTTGAYKLATVQLRLQNKRAVSQTYAGDWAWFKLVSKTLQSMVSKKELMLNFYKNDKPALYVLYTHSKLNPFLAINMNRLQLPSQLTTITQDGKSNAEDTTA